MAEQAMARASARITLTPTIEKPVDRRGAGLEFDQPEPLPVGFLRRPDDDQAEGQPTTVRRKDGVEPNPLGGGLKHTEGVKVL
jgi:hypothetical protein